MTGSDGSFTLKNVPVGHFTLLVSGGFDPATNVVYGNASLPVDVIGTDIEGLIIHLSPKS
jgi:hypothetical protein